MKIKRFFSSILIMWVILIGNITHAAPVQVPLPFGERDIDDEFGQRVLIDGDTALISSDKGIYVYVRNGTVWTLQTKLQANDGAVLTLGALDGDTAVGYTRTLNGNEGAVYVFVRNNTVWTQQARLVVGPNHPLTRISGPVDLDGDTLLVGALYYEEGGNGDKPALHGLVYTRSGSIWDQYETALEGWNTNIGGNSLSLSGDIAILNTAYSDDDLPVSSSIRMYERSGEVWISRPDWSKEIRDATDPGIPGVEGYFSGSMALSGNTFVISGYRLYYDEDYNIVDQSEVTHLFAFDGVHWNLQAALTPTNPQGEPYDLGGFSLENDTLLISASDSHSMYILDFVRNGTSWTLQNTWDHSIPSPSVSHSGNTVLIGSRYEGAVYVYIRGGGTWSLQAKIMLEPLLLVNAGFEIDANNDLIPDGWTAKGAGIQQTCTVAYFGLCSLAFTSHGLSNKIVQNVDLNVFNLQAGDKIKLTGTYFKQNSLTAQVRLFVSYADLPKDQKRVSVTRPTSNWRELPPISQRLKATPTRVRVVIEGYGENGLFTYFDYMHLIKVDNQGIETELPLIPLPPAPSSNLSGRQ